MTASDTTTTTTASAQQNGDATHTHAQGNGVTSKQQQHSTATAAEHDEEQLKLMNEECILVDVNDQIIGHASKRACHQHDGVNDVPLHRAFSVFLFNTRGELLLQKRSAEKITFPARWTNTCCSHPLYEYVKERDDRISSDNEALGVKHAAIRKLQHELGITPDALQLNDFHYLTKIHYGAHSDATWGEHEIDWILFVQKDVQCHVNPNEVSDIMYVTPAQLREMIVQHQNSSGNGNGNGTTSHRDRTMQRNEGSVLTPWFSLIANELLFPWWQELASIVEHDGLKGSDEKHKIYRLGEKKNVQCERERERVWHDKSGRLISLQ